MPLSHPDPHAPVIDVAIADDHPVVVMGIRKLLESERDLRVAATANDVNGLMRVLDATPCDVLVCDFTFVSDGAQDGLRLMQRLRQRFPALRIIVLTFHEDPVLVERVLSLGVAGFIGKTSLGLEALPLAIRSVRAGRVYLDPAAAGRLAARSFGRKAGSSALGRETLTRREFEVVRQLVKGMSITDIARETHRSVKTISTQKNSAMEKLGARNDVELGERFRTLTDDDALW